MTESVIQQAEISDPSGVLKTAVIKAQSLSENARFEMYGLYQSYYAGTSLSQFLSDLGEKDLVLLLADHAGGIKGFTTLKIIRSVFNNHPVRVIFSGDTIIHHAYWGQQTLPLAWCELAGRIKSEEEDVPLYWFLIVKGHRTYRYLNVFSREYYPNRRKETPPDTQNLMNLMAHVRFGAHYDPESGVIEFPESHGHLKPEWATSKFDKNPETQFFYQKNPNYAMGSELVCLAELHEDNLRSLALKGFQQGLKHGPLEERK